MFFKKVTFAEAGPVQWDRWVEGLSGTSYFHSSWWLDHLMQFPDIKGHLSFVLLDSEGQVLALCPLAVSFLENEKLTTLSFGYSPCGAPVIADLVRRDRKKVQDAVMRQVSVAAVANKAQRVSFVWHPVNTFFMSSPVQRLQTPAFDLMRYRMLYEVENSVVIDLSKPEEDLAEDISKYHYRHIKRGVKKGLSVKVFNREHELEKVDKVFELFEQAHIASAGRMTRPQATWDSMLQILQQGNASLFVAYFEGTPVSFLFCGEFSGMAFGWSQVNLDEYEKTLSPRHLLEWEAIMHYKKNNFKFYEVGERYFGPQTYHVPTAKELSISIFKERYGGILLPKIKWIGYFDQDLLRSELGQKSGQFVESARLFSEFE